jgi:hypothetical protein
MWIEYLAVPVAASIAICATGWRRSLRRLLASEQERKALAKASLVLEEERRVLQLVARGASLQEVLDALTQAIERLTTQCFCTVLLLDDDGRRLLQGSGGSFPAEYMRAINGLEIGPDVGACGTAAFRNETTIVEDIATDPRFASANGFVLSASWKRARTWPGTRSSGCAPKSGCAKMRNGSVWPKNRPGSGFGISISQTILSRCRKDLRPFAACLVARTG